MDRMNMQEAVAFLYDIPRFTTKNSQMHTKEFLALLGSPEDSFCTVHVAGSNGKGSVCRFLFELLKLTGEKTGLFTSPHLVDIRERFLVFDPEKEEGGFVAEEEFLAVFSLVKEAAEQQEKNSGSYPTFFEFVFAMGMVLFQRAGVKYCVLETGLGGRLDATNTVTAPMLTILTSISLEHTEYLGDTIAAIAGEKAGIIKPGVPVIFDANEPEANEVIKARAAALDSPFYGLDKNMCPILEIKRKFIEFSISTGYDKETRWQVPFAASYQGMNAALAITAMRVLLERGKVQIAGPVTEKLSAAIAGCRWPGRMEETREELFLDGAHNLSGVTAFVSAARELVREDVHRPILLFSMVKEKDYRQAIACLAKGVDWGSVYVATIPNQRGIPAEELQQIFAREQLAVEAVDDHKQAFDRAYAGKKEGQKLFCTGSLYFIGALKEYIDSHIQEDEG